MKIFNIAIILTFLMTSISIEAFSTIPPIHKIGTKEGITEILRGKIIIGENKSKGIRKTTPLSLTINTSTIGEIAKNISYFNKFLTVLSKYNFIKIQMDNYKFGEDEAELIPFIEIFAAAKNTRLLTLRGNEIGNDQLNKIAPALHSLHNLESLDLSFNKLDPKSMKILFSSDLSVKELSLSYNPLTPEGVANIMEGLIHMPKLEILRLNEVMTPTTEGTQKILETLEETLSKYTPRFLTTIELGETSKKLAEGINNLLRKKNPNFSTKYTRASSWTSWYDNTLEIIGDAGNWVYENGIDLIWGDEQNPEPGTN